MEILEWLLGVGWDVRQADFTRKVWSKFVNVTPFHKYNYVDSTYISGNQ